MNCFNGRGEITEKIQKAFFEITKGERKAPGDWLTYVKAAKKSRPGNNGHQADKESGVTAPTEPVGEQVLKYQTAASIPD